MDKRYDLYCQMINELDEASRFIQEYDSIPHDYGAAVLYQAESQIIHLVGRIPGITAREIAEVFKKTPSACSQLIRKLREKGWISQILNTEKHREYRLFLTDSGKKIFRDHDAFEQRCYQRSFHRLDGFSEEDFKTYIAIQKCLNESFALDVEESRCNLPANKPDDL